MFTVAQAGQEVVHVADESGCRCSRCGSSLAEFPVYTVGQRVVVVDGDPVSSWRTGRTPNCGDRW